MRGRIIEMDAAFGFTRILAEDGHLYTARSADLETVLAVGGAVEFVAREVGRARVARHVDRPAPARCAKCETPLRARACATCGLVAGAPPATPRGAVE